MYFKPLLSSNKTKMLKIFLQHHLLLSSFISHHLSVPRVYINLSSLGLSVAILTSFLSLEEQTTKHISALKLETAARCSGMCLSLQLSGGNRRENL